MAKTLKSNNIKYSKLIAYIVIASQIMIILPEIMDICLSLTMKLSFINNKKRFCDGLFCQINEIRIVSLFGHIQIINGLKQFITIRLHTIKILITYITFLLIKIKYDYITHKDNLSNNQKLSIESQDSYLNTITLVSLMAEECYSILPFV